jgi:hypothetical protein
MVRRTHTPPCVSQSFVVQQPDGARTTSGCAACGGSGWQYTEDGARLALKNCAPEDDWNDARSILMYHEEAGGPDGRPGGPDDPIKIDCDDGTIICAACAKFEAWDAAGRPIGPGGVGLDVGPEIVCAIAKPDDSNVAHAFMLCGCRPIAGEPLIQVDGLWVFDPAARWGMPRPPDSFYGSGVRGTFPLRFSDLLGRVV